MRGEPGPELDFSCSSLSGAGPAATDDDGGSGGGGSGDGDGDGDGDNDDDDVPPSAVAGFSSLVTTEGFVTPSCPSANAGRLFSTRPSDCPPRLPSDRAADAAVINASGTPTGALPVAATTSARWARSSGL